MEWQGIDLSFLRQKVWMKRIKLNFIKMFICMIISSLISVGVVFYNKNMSHQYNLALEEHKKDQKKIDIINAKVSKLKSNVKKENVKVVSHQAFQIFLDYIKTFQVSGVVETILLYKENETISRIIGKLHHQSEFQTIEQQLKQIDLAYQVEQYQTNEKQQIEFTILIKLGD